MLNPNFAAVVNYFTFNESARYLFAITVVEAVDAVLVFPFAVYVIACYNYSVYVCTCVQL